MVIINLTPHDINLLDADNNEICVFEKSENPVRVTVEREKVSNLYIDGHYVPVYKSIFGQTENLPEPNDDEVFIVSRIVAEANSNRKDLYVVEDTVRDAAGRIVGCHGFGTI